VPLIRLDQRSHCLQALFDRLPRVKAEYFRGEAFSIEHTSRRLTVRLPPAQGPFGNPPHRAMVLGRPSPAWRKKRPEGRAALVRATLGRQSLRIAVIRRKERCSSGKVQDA
jgi:hypothetical protein